MIDNNPGSTRQKTPLSELVNVVRAALRGPSCFVTKGGNIPFRPGDVPLIGVLHIHLVIYLTECSCTCNRTVIALSIRMDHYYSGPKSDNAFQ